MSQDQKLDLEVTEMDDCEAQVVAEIKITITRETLPEFKAMLEDVIEKYSI